MGQNPCVVGSFGGGSTTAIVSPATRLLMFLVSFVLRRIISQEFLDGKRVLKDNERLYAKQEFLECYG
jgi:hypothetical protein